MKNTNPKCGVINYITNYYGFTLNDLVSYERKHNELNGEDNADGTDYNLSWNCGAEGPSRKKAVRQQSASKATDCPLNVHHQCDIPESSA